MNARDRNLVVQLCAHRAGLAIDPDRPYLIESRLAPLTRREGYGSVSELLQALRDRAEERLAWAVVEAMCPADSGFFADRAVFGALAGEVLPQLAARRGAAPLRIWSAGCGAGQEAYSLAMLVAEMPGVSARILASDLSQRALEKAQAGLYSQFEVQRGLPARRLVDHFVKREDDFILSEDIRQTVSWRRVNLIEDLSGLGPFDLIVCVRGLGGLTDAARRKVSANFASVLAPEGYLATGCAAPARYFGPALIPAGRPGFLMPPSRIAAAA